MQCNILCVPYKEPDVSKPLLSEYNGWREEKTNQTNESMCFGATKNVVFNATLKCTFIDGL